MSVYVERFNKWLAELEANQIQQIRYLYRSVDGCMCGVGVLLHTMNCPLDYYDGFAYVGTIEGKMMEYFGISHDDAIFLLDRVYYLNDTREFSFPAIAQELREEFADRIGTVTY